MGLRPTDVSTDPNPLPHQARGHIRQKITALSAVRIPLPLESRGHLESQPSHRRLPSPGHPPDTRPGHPYLTQVREDTRRDTRAGKKRTDEHRRYQYQGGNHTLWNQLITPCKHQFNRMQPAPATEEEDQLVDH